MKDGLYISEDSREDITVWGDLDKPGRIQHLRVRIATEAAENGKRRKQLLYTDVIELFDEYLEHKPSPQYAYDAMEAAASVDGFSYGDVRGEKRLRYDRQQIPESFRSDVILEHDIDPRGESPKKAQTAESPDTESREAGSSTGNPMGEAGKTGTDEASEWVKQAADNLPGDVDVGDLPDATIDNKIARARYVDGAADLDEKGTVLQSRLDRVGYDERQRLRDFAGDTDNDTDGDNEAAEDTLDALEQATPEAMTDGGSDTERGGDC
jgi:hypothetical protein